MTQTDTLLLTQVSGRRVTCDTHNRAPLGAGVSCVTPRIGAKSESPKTAQMLSGSVAPCNRVQLGRARGRGPRISGGPGLNRAASLACARGGAQKRVEPSETR